MVETLLHRGRWLLACLVVTGAPACAPQEADTPAVGRAAEDGEHLFSNLTQLTFSGQNAEAYFAPDGESLIFQRTGEESQCDQQYVIGIDGSGLEMVSNGLGRTTCGYFYDGGSRILYYWYNKQGLLLMLFIFRKNEKDDLTKTQLKALKTIVEREYK